MHRWRQDPEFRDQLAQLQRQYAELAKGCLQSLAFQAVVHLGSLLENSNPEICLRAILSYSTKFGEIRELHDQVEALEAALPLWTAQRKSR